MINLDDLLAGVLLARLGFARLELLDAVGVGRTLVVDVPNLVALVAGLPLDRLAASGAEASVLVLRIDGRAVPGVLHRRLAPARTAKAILGRLGLGRLGRL